MSPTTPDERRAEWFAANPQADRVPDAVPPPTPCPICGEELRLDDFLTCSPCAVSWETDGTSPEVVWEAIDDDPDHPLHGSAS